MRHARELYEVSLNKTMKALESPTYLRNYAFHDGASHEALPTMLDDIKRLSVSAKGLFYSEIRATPKPTQQAPAQRV